MIKCICGYKYSRDYDKEPLGDTAFITIKGHFTKEGCDYYRHQIEVDVIACPKCGTLKIDI